MQISHGVFWAVAAGSAFFMAACAPTTQTQSTALTETAPSAPADAGKPAEAEAPAEEAARVAAEEKAYDPDERICKRIKSTGSNFTRRRCQTRAEWDEDAKQARDALDRLDRKNREGCTVDQQC